MYTNQYIASERFIHDELLRRATAVVETLPTLWKRDGFVAPSIFIWPSESIKTDDKSEHEGLIVGALPTNSLDRAKFMRQAITKARPYAVLVVESAPHHLHALFETHHGTRAWTTLIEEHGDARVLADTLISDDKECLGFLWRKDTGKS